MTALPSSSSSLLATQSARLVASLTTFLGTSMVYVIRKRFMHSKANPSAQRGVGNPTAEKTRACADDSADSWAEIEELRSRHFCGSVSVSYSNSGPLMIIGGHGARLVDSTGRSYLDTRNNVAHCGHQNPRVVEAVRRQIDEINTNTRYLHPNATLLAKKLADLLPDPLDVVFLVNSGSEANDLALRLARAYTKSKNTIVVDGAYHGHTLACLEVSPYKYEHSAEFDLEWQRRCADSSGGVDGVRYDAKTYNAKTPGRHIWKVPCPDTYRGPHRGPDAAKKYAEYVQEACRVYREDRGEDVGAFIVEGGMSVAGVILPPPSYLKRCVDAVRDAGGVYIADEVQTGFGRLGSCYWAFQHGCRDSHEGVVPDILTVGKPFGNGMPLAAVITTQEISKAFENMRCEYFNTFGGNPVCSAAGLAVLDAVESDSLQAHAKTVGQYLMERFVILKGRIDLVGDVRGSGLFIGIELVRNRKTLEPARAETSFLCTALKEKYAVLTSIDGPHNNVLVIKPPMVFNKQDADTFVEAFESAVNDDLAQADISAVSKTPT